MRSVVVTFFVIGILIASGGQILAQCATVSDVKIRVNNNQDISLLSTPGTIDICDVLDPLEVILIFEGVSDVMATVDWGDGTVENIPSGNSILHVYEENVPSNPEYIIDVALTEADGINCTDNISKPISINRRTLVLGLPQNFAGGLACLPTSGEFIALMDLEAGSLSENSSINVNWGDGTIDSFTEQQIQDNGNSLPISHTYTGVTVTDVFEVTVTSQNALNSGCVLQAPVIQLSFQNEIAPTFSLSGDICESGGTISVAKTTNFLVPTDEGDFRWIIENATTATKLLETSFAGAFIVSNINFSGDLNTFDLELLDSEINDGDDVQVTLIERNSCGEISLTQDANILSLPNTSFSSFDGTVITDPLAVITTCIKNLNVEFNNTAGFDHEWILVDGHSITDAPTSGLTSFTPPLALSAAQITPGNKTLFVRSVNDVVGVACDNFIKLELSVRQDVSPDFTISGDLSDNCGSVILDLDGSGSTNLVNGDQITFEYATNSSFTENFGSFGPITAPITSISGAILNHITTADEVTYFIRASVTTPEGCTFTSSTQQQSVQEQPDGVNFNVQLVNGEAPSSDESNFIFCAGDRVSVQLSSTSSNNTVYNWTPPTDATLDDATPNNSALVFIVAETSDGSNIAVEEDLFGCTFTSTSDPITVNPTPGVVVISVLETNGDGSATDGAFCENAGSFVTLTADPDNSGSWSYQWFKDGLAVSGATAQTLQIAAVSESGDYTVSVRGFGACATLETEVTPVAVEIQPALSASLAITSGSDTFCEGSGSVTLTATESSGFDFQANAVQWFKFDGSSFVPEIITTGVRSFTLSSQSGRYRVQLFGAGVDNCASSISNIIEITINDVPVAPSIAVVSGFNAITCSDPSPTNPDVRLELLNTATYSPISDFNFTWKNNGLEVTDADGDPTTLEVKGSANDGAYTIEVTTVAGNCTSVSSNTVNLTITDPPSAIPNAVASTNNTCVNDGDITLSVDNNPGGLGQEWFSSTTSNFDDASAIATTSTITVSDGTTSDLYYFVRFIADPAGAQCEGVASSGTQIIVNPLPSAPILSSTISSVCEGNSITITAIPSGPETEFRWYRLPDIGSALEDGAGNVINGSNLEVSEPGLGQNYVARSVSAFGCFSANSSSIGLDITPLPPINTGITISSASVCQGESVNVTIPGSVTNYLYELLDASDNVLSSSNGNNGLLTLSSGGLTTNTTLRVRATVDLVLCNQIITASPFDVVIFEQAPTAELVTTDANRVVCSGDPVPLQLNVPVNARPPFQVTYKLDGGSDINITTPSLAPFTFNTNPVVNNTIVELVSVIDNEGCPVVAVSTSPDPLNITVDNPNSATLSASAAICSGDQLTVDLSISGGIGPFDFEIQYGANMFSGTTTAPHNSESILLPLALSGSTTVSLISVTTANGCDVDNLSSDFEVSFNDPDEPTITIIGSTLLCDDGGATSVTLVASAAGADSFEWFEVTNPAVVISTSSALILDEAGDTGSYSVRSVNSTSGCISTTTPTAVPVSIITPPEQPMIEKESGLDDPFCDEGANAITLRSSIAGDSYRWFKDASELGVTTRSIVLNDASASGAYTVRVVNSSPISCESPLSNSRAVTIVALPATPSVEIAASSIDNDGIFCDDWGLTSVTLASSTLGESYNWYFDSGSGEILLSDNTQEIILDAQNQSGVYSVEVIGTNPTNCVSLRSAMRTISINEIPASPIISGLVEHCVGTVDEFYFVTPLPGATYNWTIPAGVVSELGGSAGDSFVRLSFPNAGSFDIQLSITVNGCESPLTALPVDILVPTSTSPITGEVTVCENTSDVAYTVSQTSGSTYQWTVPGGAFITAGQGTNEITVQYGASAAAVADPILQVIETNSAGCESSPVQEIITVNPNPSVTIGGTFDICEGESFGLEIDWSGALPLNVEYSIDGVSQNTPITIPMGSSNPYLFSVSPTSTTIYTLDGVNDDNNCEGTVAGLTRLNVAPTPQLEIGPNQAIPQASSITLIPDVLSGTFSTIEWSATPVGSGTFDNVNATSPTFTPLATFTGSTTISAVVNDASAICPDVSDDLILTVNAAGTIFAGNDINLCNGDVANFVDAARDVTGDYDNYAWSSNRAGSFSNPTISSPTNDDALHTEFTPSGGTGEYTISLEAIDLEGALPVSISSFTLTVNEVPNAVLITTSEQFICDLETATLTVQLTGNSANGPWAIEWEDDLGNTDTESGITSSPYDFEVPGAVGESRTYSIRSVTENDGIVCSNPSPAPGDVTVTKRGLPTAEIISTNAEVCQGTSTEVTVALTGLGPWNIRWSDDGGATATQINNITASPFTFPVSPPVGTTTYTIEEVIENNQVSCTGTIVNNPQVIIINPLPTATISGSTTICAGQSTDLIFNLTGSSTWAVTYNDGTSDVTITAANATRVVSVSPAVTTTYTLVSITDGNGCITTGLTQTAVVQVRDLPMVDAGTDQSIPVNTLVSLTPTVGGSFTTVLWDDGGLGGSFGNPSTSNTSYTPPVDFVGTATLTLTIGDGSGPCDDNISDQLTVTYNAAGSVVAGNDEALCDGDAIVLDDAQLAADYERYSWGSDRLGTFSVATVDNPLGASELTTTFTPSNGPGPYIITLTAEDLDGILPETSNTLTVTVNPLPTATISGSTTICAGQSTDLTFNLTGLSPWNVTYNDGMSDVTVPAASSTHVVSVSPAVTTTYTLVSVTDDNGCVTAGLTQTAVVQVRDLPTVDAGSDRSVPVNTVVSLTPTLGGSFTDVLWDDSGLGGTFGNASSSNTSYTPPTDFVGIATLNLTTGDGDGPCDDDISDQVVITYNAAGNVVAGNNEILCNGDNVLLDDAQLAASYERYIWSSDRPGAFSLSAIDNPTTASDLNTTFAPSNGIGDYVVTLTVVDLDGILPDASATLTVSVDALPTVTIAGAATICEGQATDLTFFLTGKAPWSITYSDGTNSLATTAASSPYTITVTPTANTAYTLVSVTDDNTCTASGLTQSVLVQVRDLPTVNVGGDQSVPLNTSVSLIPTLGGSFTSVFWDDGGIGGIFGNPSTSNTSYTPPLDFVGTAILSLTVGDGAGPCADDITDQLTVTYNVAGSVVAGNDEELCDGDAILLDDAQLAADYERYIWSADRPGTFSLITIDNPLNTLDLATTFTPSNGPGTYIVTLRAVDLNGVLPETSDALTLTTNPLPTATISGSTTICAGQSTDLIFSLEGSSPWSVTYNDGTGDITIPAGSSTQVVSVNPIATTTYTLVDVTDDNGCITTGLTQTAVVQVRDLPMVDAGTDQSIPVNTLVSLTPTVGGSFTTVLWDDGGLGGSFGNPSTSNTSYTPPVDFVGTATLTLTIGDGSGPCDDNISDQLTVTYNAAGSVVAGNDEALCDGDAIVLDDAQLAADYERYSWGSDRPGTFSVATVDNPLGASELTTTFTPSNGPGPYIITLTAEDLDGILPETSNTLTVTVNPLPTATISGSTTICAGQSTNLTFNLTGLSPWNVTYNDGMSDVTVPAASSTHVVSVSPAVTTTYTLVSVTDDNGCVTAGLTQTAVVQVRDLPTVDAGSDRSVPVNTVVSLTPTLGGSFTDVLWDDSGLGGTFGNASSSNTSYTPPTDFVGIATLNLTTGDGGGPCDDDIADQVVITYNESGNVEAGDDQISCDGNTISVMGTADVNYEQVLWTSNRSGTFNSTTSLSSDFTPSDGAGIYILTLTATDDEGSLPTVNDQMQVDFHSLPQAQFINTNERFICEGEMTTLDVQLNGNSANGPWKIVYEDDLGNSFTEENITSSNYQLDVDGTPGESRTYTLVAVEEDDGVLCDGQVTGSPVVVTQRVQSTAEIVSSNLDVCLDEPTEITVAFTGTGPWNIRWSDNGGATSLPINGITSSPHTFSVNAPTGTTTTYSLVSVNEVNTIVCAGTVLSNTVDIKVNESPTASLSGSTFICNGESAELTINLTGTPPWDVNYTNGTNTVPIDNILSSPYTFSVDPVATQSYSLVDVSDGNSNSCFGSISGNVLVQVRPLPTVNPSSEASFFCSGEVIPINGNPSGGSGEYVEHIWSGTGAAFLDATNIPNPLFQHTVSATTTYELVYTLRDQNTCEAVSDLLSLTVNPRPTVNPTPEATQICSGETLSINGNASGGVGSLDHLWTGTGAPFLNADNVESPEFNAAVTEITTFELIYSAQDDNECTDEKSISITVFPAIEIAPLDDAIICQKEDLVLNAEVSGKFTGLQWSSDVAGTFDNASGANAIFTPDPGVTGAAVITLTATDAEGFCGTDVTSLTLEIKEEIIVSAGENQTLCQEEAVELFGSVTGNFTDLAWSTSGAGDLVNASSLNANYLPADEEIGLVTFTLMASDASSVCEPGSSEVSVNFNRTISIEVSSEAESCQGDPILIEGTVTGTFSELSWSSVNAGTFSNRETAVTTYFPSPDEVGLVELTLTALDGENICPNTSESILVEIKPRPLVNAGDNLTINEGETAVIVGEVTGSFDRVEWNSNKGGSFSPVDQVVSVYTPEANEEGFTVLTLTAFDDSGICASVSDQSVLEIIPKAPIAQLSSTITEGCLPLEVSFTNESLEAEENGYFWDFGDGSNVINTVDATHTFQTSGSYTVTLTATNSSGATNQAILQITVFDLPTAVFSIDPVEYFVPDPLQITNTSIGGAQYLWDFGDGTTSDAFQPFKIYDMPGTYEVSLLVISQQGCESEFVFEEEIIMKEGGSLEIPNAFTPNVTGPGDGRIVNFNDNDVFLPITKGVSEFDMKIYNRWGAQVFESNDPEVGWTGYIDNELAASGTYSYAIKIRFSDGKVVDKAGTLNLIR